MTRIVVDTGVFFRPDRLRAAADDPRPFIVPAVAYAERLRQLAARGVPAGDIAAFAVAMRPVVEAFDMTEAERFVPRTGTMPRARWRSLARDALIAGHVRPDDELWTTDPSDFRELGLAEAQIVAV